MVTRLLAGAASGLLVLAAGVACASGISVGAAYCTVRAEVPLETARGPGQVVGKVRISCTESVDSVSAVAKLQEKLDGQWVDLLTAGPETQALPEPNETYTVRATTLCRAGTFRTAGQGWGTDGGERSDTSVWEHSAEVDNPCQEPRNPW